MRLLLFICCLTALSACTSAHGPADLILTNGKIYTVDESNPWVSAVAVSGQRYTYVGDNRGAMALRGGKTKVIDLDGNMAMPGINEAHAHPILGGIESLQCLFSPAATPAEIRASIEACRTSAPHAPWIVGGRWSSSLFKEHDLGNPRLWLDAFSADKAISLADDTGHNRWVNSKALALAGITAETRIAGGEVGVDANGALNGLLFESAMHPVLQAIPQLTTRQYKEVGLRSFKTANSYGMTGVMEAGDAREGVIAYKQMDAAGQLTVHLGVAIVVPLQALDRTLDREQLLKLRDENRGTNVHPEFAKIFLDGVPTTARTAAMLAPYAAQPQDQAPVYGELLLAPEEMTELISELDALGFTVLVHAAGDRSVRVVLDAVEVTRQQNGASGLRHQLAHGGYIHPDDIPRLRALNVTADFSPYLWYPSPIADNIISALGPRGEHYWPTRSLLDSGAEVVVGSDYPAVLPNMNPWVGLESLVTRANPIGNYPGTLWKEQAVSLAEALRIFTLAGAKALRLDAQTGSVEVGKFADLIVLNHNLFDIPVDKISDTRVLRTLFKGQTVYRAQQ